MQNRYCLPILKSSKEGVVNTIEEYRENYAYFEVWIDYIEDFEPKFALSLTKEYPGKIVFVFRRQSLEPIKMSVSDRLEVLDALSGKDCLIDLDITCQKEDLLYTKDKDIKLIASYHNYEVTPSNEELSKTVQELRSYSPNILKLSTMCNDSKDALRLFKLKADLLQENQKHIVLGMGEAGKITRVFGALCHNELLFIPETNDNESAPGQISRKEFDKIMERVSR